MEQTTPAVLEQTSNILADRSKMAEEEFPEIDKAAQESERCKTKIARYDTLRTEHNVLKRKRAHLLQDISR